MGVTGAWLFSGFATKAYGHAAFRIKLAVLVLAGVNALIFSPPDRARSGRLGPCRSTTPRCESRGAHLPGPVGDAPFCACAFHALCGRVMSYTMF